MKKNIKNIFQKWGNDSQELPEKNSILKEEVLSKVPFNVSEYRRKEKKSVLPYFSLAFVGVAMLFVVINLFPKESKNNFAQNEVINNNKQIAKVLNNDKKESDIVASVKKRIEELKPSFPQGVELEVTYDRSELILHAIATLKHQLG